MAFLMAVFGGAADFHLEGRGVQLRPPRMGDYAAWVRLRSRSREFLTPWEPNWPPDELSRRTWRERLRGYASDMRRDRTYPFLVFRAADGVLVGGCTLSNVRRGVQQTCTLGYWAGEPHAGRGYMSAAVRAVLGFAFGPLALERVEAACMPHNEASRRVLLSCGFVEEGYAREFLRINGVRRDHVLFARLPCAGDQA